MPMSLRGGSSPSPCSYPSSLVPRRCSTSLGSSAPTESVKTEVGKDLRASSAVQPSLCRPVPNWALFGGCYSRHFLSGSCRSLISGPSSVLVARSVRGGLLGSSLWWKTRGRPSLCPNCCHFTVDLAPVEDPCSPRRHLTSLLSLEGITGRKAPPHLDPSCAWLAD